MQISLNNLYNPCMWFWYVFSIFAPYNMTFIELNLICGVVSIDFFKNWLKTQTFWIVKESQYLYMT